MKKALSLEPALKGTLAGLAYTHAVSGDQKEALRILEEVKSGAETDDFTVEIAQVYIGLGDKDRAFEWLEKAYQRRSVGLRRLKWAFFFDPIRSDPRFHDLLRRMGLLP